MRDIQADTTGFPAIPIGKVGIKNIELPVWVTNHNGTFISTMANVSSYCNLTESVRGINMSRIPRTIFEVFDPSRKELVTALSREVVEKLQESHETNDVYFKARFKYPYYQTSPSTELHSPEIINVTIETSLKDGDIKRYLTIEMVGMSLCPCSREMSSFMNNLTSFEEKVVENIKCNSLKEKLKEAGFGAHNQKSFIKVTVEMGSFINIEDLVELVNESVSCRVFSVLKRPDEKYVTEMSYMGRYIDEDKKLSKPEGDAGPKFVEDIARQLAEKIEVSPLDIKDYAIVIRNQESIHSNEIEAVAVLTAGKDLK